MTTSFLYPLSYTTTGEEISCCACTVTDGHGKVMADPRYASVLVCRKCGHSCCPEHYTAGLCWGCSCEEGGL